MMSFRRRWATPASCAQLGAWADAHFASFCKGRVPAPPARAAARSFRGLPIPGFPPAFCEAESPAHRPAVRPELSLPEEVLVRSTATAIEPPGRTQCPAQEEALGAVSQPPPNLGAWQADNHLRLVAIRQNQQQCALRQISLPHCRSSGSRINKGFFRAWVYRPARCSALRDDCFACAVRVRRS